MLLRRCPSRSFTIVGDRAQSRSGFDGNWDQRLNALGVHDVRLAGLTINYRTPVEIMDEAEKVIRSVIPEADVPTSVRSTGIPVHRGTVDELDAVLNDWLATHPTGTACVLDSSRAHSTPGRVSSLTPELAKGLEFDLVVLIEDSEPQAGVAAVVDRYVAMTRATQMLVILTGPRV
jgi:superfamily I DNA/RNA helicase